MGQLSGVYINNKVSIGYGYDMHGWLTSVTSPKRFTQTLRYATRSNGEYGCMDGNICEMNWSTDGPTLKNPNNPLGISRRYSYYYDNIDRLVEAKYSETKVRESPVNVTFENTPDYSTTYSYDLNGNITSLTRKGIYEKYHLSGSEYWSYATIDSLAYTLDGNRVNSINDDALCYNPAYNGAFDFPDNTYSDDEYTYDANGNMTSDSNKDITGIEYNYLNLPTCITFADGHVTEYIYDAAGTKRSAIYKVQPETLFAPVENSLESITTAGQLVVVSSKNYCDNHIYNKDGYLNTILTDNGYIDGGRYHFYIKDYQGNNRVVFDQNGDVEQVNHYYPYGGTFGEGTGFNDVQSYKYGGKELDRMNGLNTYDFGARHLDSSKGGWDGMDPMLEMFHAFSPYAYCMGNPIQNIDRNGLYPHSVLTYDPGLGKYGGYRFTSLASHLLSFVSGVNRSLIESTIIFERGFGQLPWYPASEGGGGITLGNNSSSASITFTENWFADDPLAFNGNGYGQNIFEWIRLSSHEAGHIPQISKYGGLGGYLFKFVVQYSKYGHDDAPSELEAEKGRKTFDDFNKFVNSKYGNGSIVNLFKSNRIERQKIDMLTNWWDEYQKNKKSKTNDFYNNYHSLGEGTYVWGGQDWIKK